MPLSSCVTVGNFLNLPGLWFLYLPNEGNISWAEDLRGFLQESNYITAVGKLWKVPGTLQFTE